MARQAKQGASAHNTVTASAHSRYSTRAAGVDRWTLQETARALLPGERIRVCHRAPGRRPLGEPDGVPVMVAGEKGWYRHLMTCNSVWHCPVCAAKIAEVRQADLQAAIDAGIEKGAGVLLVSLTFRHSAAQPLAESLDRFAVDLRRFKSGRRYAELRERFGIVGEVRGLEVTHGDNGWHPHTHAVTFTRARIETNAPSVPRYREINGRRVRWTIGKGHAARNIASGKNDTIKGHGLTQLKRALFALWYRARWGGEGLRRRPKFFPSARARRAFMAAELKRAKGLPSYAHGVDVRPAKYAANYAAKFGFAAELTKSHVKEARRGGRSSWQLLQAAQDGERRAAWLFREFALCFKGRRQLFWSTGLREWLGLREELTDQEAMELEPEERVQVAHIEPDLWTLIVKGRARGLVLDLAVKCKHELEGFLAELQLRAREKFGTDGSYARALWFREGLANYLNAPEPSPLLLFNHEGE